MMDPVSAAIAANVRRLRVAKGLTLSDVTVALRDIGHPLLVTVLSKLERGDRAVTAGDLVALAQVLDVEISELLVSGLCPTCGQALPKDAQQ